jgi:hypothetical protein
MAPLSSQDFLEIGLGNSEHRLCQLNKGGEETAGKVGLSPDRWGGLRGIRWSVFPSPQPFFREQELYLH